MNAPARPKLALCLPKQKVWALGIVPSPHNHWFDWKDELFSLEPKMVDRAECETDHSLLQLITYSVVINSEGSIFTYVRGNASGEERLRAKLSIGIGGHIDRMPGTNESLYLLASREAAREIQEEVGLNVHESELIEQGFLYEEETDVGKVHLGVVYYYLMTPNESLGDHEDGHIENGEFMSIYRLLKSENFNRLELWSQALVRHISTQISGEV